MVKTVNVELPNKLSALIRVALADLERVEADPDYIVNMSEWHRPMRDGKCMVCFAGAVISRHISKKRYFSAADFNLANCAKLRALDYLRSGMIKAAVACVFDSHLTIASILSKLKYERRAVPEYNGNPVMFKSIMAEIADDFEQAGC